jgi:hypothetical protein
MSFGVACESKEMLLENYFLAYFVELVFWNISGISFVCQDYKVGLTNVS